MDIKWYKDYKGLIRSYWWSWSCGCTTKQKWGCYQDVRQDDIGRYFATRPLFSPRKSAYRVLRSNLLSSDLLQRLQCTSFGQLVGYPGSPVHRGDPGRMGKGDCGDLWGPENSRQKWWFHGEVMGFCQQQLWMNGDFDGMFSSFKKWFNGDVMRFLPKKQVSFDGNLMVIALMVI